MWRSILCLVFLCCFLASAQNTDDLHIRLSHEALRGPVHRMVATERRGGGNLTFSAGPDGILLVDALTRQWAEKLRPALDDVSKARVKFIVNTHWHGDHVGGNSFFGETAVILASPQVLKKMSMQFQPPWADKPTPPALPHARPEITIDQPVSLHFNGEEVRLIPFPRSHTDGDTVVYFTGSRVVSMGDTIYLVNGILGPSSDGWSGGDLQSLARNLGALLAQIPEDAKVVPGHGPVLTIADLRAYHQIMQVSLETVRMGLAAGKSLEAMTREGLPANLPTSSVWKINSQAWIESAHESLTRKP